MTYIELARAVARRMGLQGSGPTSISSTVPVESQILNAVADTWNDIQTMRQEWRWMRNTNSFYTAVGTTTYLLGTIFAPGYRFRRYIKDTFYITVDSEKRRMLFLDYDVFRNMYANETENGVPYNFTIRPWDNSIVTTLPDALYTISFDYYKSNQSLTANTTTPEMPAVHHMAIVYGALEKMGASLLPLEQYDHYSQEYAKALGHIMRDELGKKTVNVSGIA